MSAVGRSRAPAELDPLAFPLAGSHLVEAGAGTGKTYTIAALYLRAVLGHGGAAAFSRALTPPEILVVTFTEAATEELRSRIRERLAEAAAFFLAAQAADGDDFLRALRADTPPAQWPACARRLRLAAEWMDEAAVSTIHGWCRRMLETHAFDSGSLFSQTLQTDQRELLAETVRDYWRSFVAPLDVEAARELAAWWAAPAELLAAVHGLLGDGDRLPSAPAPATALTNAIAERRRRLAELKAGWPAWADELQALLDAAVEAKRVDGRKLKRSYYSGWFDKLRDWACDPAMRETGLSPPALNRLTPAGLAEAWKVGKPPAHPALDALGALPAELAALPDARNDVLAHAARWIAERFERLCHQRAEMGFDDLLTRLDAALAGANGHRLAARIRAEHPLALIDEFQDTDPVQYRIFDRVYRVADNDPATALVLIGDPKQAIYAFRGADIHTYLAARRACAGRLATLRRNFRSTVAMVAATNRCFARAEAREDGAGAFLFRGGGDNPLPFVEAVANGRAEQLRIGGEAYPALRLALLQGAETKGAYRARAAAACAVEIARLLTLGQRGEAALVGEGFETGVRPADIAVLVNNRGEANAVRGALRTLGVRSVYLSDRESVYATDQAGEMQHWLAACAEPDDPRRLRAALATPTLALKLAELERLNQDEAAWEARVLQFRGYRECWRSQGVLPMLRRLMNDFALPARLIARGAKPGGERILTDLLHLAELLQQASALIDGEHALIRLLAEERADAATTGSGDARQLRLESDADLVQVVTVHKSKGLEYPLVFLPFACQFRAVTAQDAPFRYRDAEGRPAIALAASDQVLAAAERERLAEDLRKLYVALTRARHATWVGVAPLKALERSGLGQLLDGGQAIDAARLGALLEDLREGCDAIQVDPAPDEQGQPWRSLGTAAAPGAARTVRRPLRERWWIASYSALRATEAGGRAGDTAHEEILREAPAEPAVAPAARPRPAGALHEFPRGAAAGTFLHDLLEWAARQGFAAVATNPGLRREALARRCEAFGRPEWAEGLGNWLERFLSREFALPDAAPFAFNGLGEVVAEMEFWIEADGVDAEWLDRTVCAHTLDAAERPSLAPNWLEGMLKGFIDLIFEHGGRYYVADYKSNRLGADDDAYDAEAMRATILHARYELQYVLYLLALHRLLKARLPGYDYERHVGGAVYLFLRGHAAPTGGLHFERPPRALIEALDARFAGKAEKA